MLRIVYSFLYLCFAKVIKKGKVLQKNQKKLRKRFRNIINVLIYRY